MFYYFNTKHSSLCIYNGGVSSLFYFDINFIQLYFLLYHCYPLHYPDMHRSLDQIFSSVDDQSHQIMELQAHSVRLEKDLRLIAHKQRSWPSTPQTEAALGPLKQELDYRRQQGDELETMLSETEGELQAAEESLQVYHLSHLDSLCIPSLM